MFRPEATVPCSAAVDPPGDPASARLTRIYRRWLAVKDRAPRIGSFLNNSRAVSALIGVALPVIAQVPDQAVWHMGISKEAEALARHLFSPHLPWALLLVALLNGGLIDRLLAQVTAREGSCRSWLRTLRLLACCIPLVNLYAVPVWLGLLRKNPTWAFPRENAKESIPSAMRAGGFWYLLGRSTSGTFRRLLTSSWTNIWLIVSNIIILVTWSFQLSSPVFRTSHGYVPALMASLLCHLFAAAGIVHWLFPKVWRTNTGEWRRFLLIGLPVFWLIPLPFFFMLGFLMVFLVDAGTGGQLVEKAYAHRHRMGRLASWFRLEETLRRQLKQAPWWRRWLRWPKPPATEVTPERERTRLLWLYRSKSFTLAFESAGFGFLMYWITERWPWTEILGWGFVLALLVAPVAALGGTLIVAVHLVHRMTRTRSRLRVLDHHPYAAYLVTTQLTFVMGAAAGMCLYKESGETLAGVYFWAGSVGFFAAFVRMFPPVAGKDLRYPWDVLWMALSFALLSSSFSMTQAPANVHREMALLRLVVLNSPFFSAYAVAQVPWLLRPFTAKDVLSPGLPRRLRLTLAFLVLTTALPLGGLAIPLWIFARHRLLPATRTG